MGRKNKNKKIPTKNDHIKSENMVADQLPDIQQQQVIRVPMIIIQEQKYVQEQKYAQLLKDNKDLNDQIHQLTKEKTSMESNVTKLMVDLMDKDHTIDILKRENKELRERIDQLEKENEELREQVKQLRRENEALRERVKQLENDNIVLKISSNKTEMRFQRRKIITAIQDVNRIDSLERKVNRIYRENLADLRDDRNTDSHYIQENRDVSDILRYKKFILAHKMSNLSQELKKSIEITYGNGFVNEIIKHIRIDEPVISEENKERINEWWDA